MAKFFRPRLTNKLIDIDYQDENIILAKYYNQRDKYGYHMHNGITYVFTYNEELKDWRVSDTIEFCPDSNGWWFRMSFFNTHEDIARYWALFMFDEKRTPPLTKKEKEDREMDSLINAHICEYSEGMLSLSHTGA